jgi:hypothetical protein
MRSDFLPFISSCNHVNSLANHFQSIILANPFQFVFLSKDHITDSSVNPHNLFREPWRVSKS